MQNKRGFTLVEVIVVAVIVAVLALVAVMLYMGYIHDARKNVVENVAASAASFINSAENNGITVNATTFPQLTGGQQWTVILQSGNSCIHKCPANVTITLDYANKNVSAELEGITSSDYMYSR
jgi:prepilin-type N-terminal cleavage/methylation domain-containing protein